MGAIDKLAEEFAGRPVRKYDPGRGIVDPASSAQRLELERFAPGRWPCCVASPWLA